MNRSTPLLGVALLSLSSLVGCGADKLNELASAMASSSAAGASSGGAKGAAAGGSKKVDLAPLPLTLELPADEAGLTMDKTMNDKKSVGVSYDALFAGINVSEPAEKSFDEVKASVKGDTVMFPFKKFVEESPTSAIAEVTADSKTAYTAWSWKTIGGKPYVCQSAGLSGLKSVDDAKKVLKACDSLAAK